MLKQAPLFAMRYHNTKGSAVEIPQPLHAWAVLSDDLPSLNNRVPQNLSDFWCLPLRSNFDRQFPRAEGGKNQIEVILRQQSLLTIIYMQN